MPRSKRLILLGLLLLTTTSALFLVSCASPSDSPWTQMPTPESSPTPMPSPTPLTPETTEAPTSPTAIPQAIVHLNLGEDPPTLDPAQADSQAALDVQANLFLGLTRVDPETGEVLPELARSWEASDDATVWTFHLRDDVYWVQFDPETADLQQLRHVTAQDVLYGIRRSLMPETESAWAYVLYPIHNAERIHKTDPLSDSYDIESLGVQAPDDYTIQFELDVPAAYFPVIAGMWVAKAQPQEPIEEYGKDWVEPGHIWTNGAYFLQSWDHDQRIVLARNPHHYRAADVEIELVDMVMIEGDAEALETYEAGNLDSVMLPAAGRELSCWPQCEVLDPVLFQELVIVSLPCTYYYGFNTARPPFDDVHVRRAFSYAIDRQYLIKDVLQDVHRIAHSFAGPATWGTAAYDQGVGIYYDPELAQAELAEAGYPDGQGFPEVTLMYNSSDWNTLAAQTIQQMWQETLGVGVQLEQMGWDDYQTLLSADVPAEEVPHIWRMGWCAYYPDQHNWLYQVFNPTEGDNRPRLSQQDPQVGDLVEEFDQLTRQAAAELDPIERVHMYKQAEQLLNVDLAAIAPIYHYTVVIATKPHLQRDYSMFGGVKVERWKIER